MYVSATQSCGGISRRNGWHSHGRTDSTKQRAVRTHRPTPRGAVLAALEGGGSLVAADLDGRQRESDGDGGPQIGGPGGRGWKRWSPPSPDPCHTKIAAMMNPYLELSNGILSLPSILHVGKIKMEDLPGLNKYKDPTTGRHIFCWADVLGPCHLSECYFGKKGDTPSGRITLTSLRSRWFRFCGRGLRPGWWQCVPQTARELKWNKAPSDA